LKKLFFLFFCFLSFSSFSHHIGEPGNVVINDNNTDDHGLSAIFSLPIRIFEDGTVGFSWRTNTEVTTEPTDRVPTEPPRRREEINWYISPLVYVKLEKFKYFLNLEDHSLNKAITLEEGNSRAGYMVCEKNEFDFGIGAGFFTGKDFIVGGGLIPIFGGLVYSERFAPDFETAKSLKKVVFPKNAEGFKNWNKGDIIVYTKKAGINFYASASYFGPSVGVGFAAYGNWKVTLKKTGKNKIMASATKIDLIFNSVCRNTSSKCKCIHFWFKG
jgi:hypothetical protein